jgi:NTP pyrophosphatase (non-canonical NTP hydrolase)
MAQWIKACQEMEELRLGLVNNDDAEIKDGVGDVVVCLINLCALADIDLVSCLEGAYQEIKDRTGHMGEDGIFYKDK